MTRTRWASAMILAAAMIAGCQQNKKPTTPQPVPVTAETRQRIQRLAPDAVIGQVIAILPEERLIAVGDLPIQDFKPGQVLSFIGGEPEPVGAGVVVSIVRDTLHVRYEPPPPGGRPPAVGDLAIRFRK